MKTDHYYVKDWPENDGRKPVPGEHGYSFTFPLRDGNSVVIHCGEETLDKFRDFLGSMTIDEEAEREGGGSSDFRGATNPTEQQPRSGDGEGNA